MIKTRFFRIKTIEELEKTPGVRFAGNSYHGPINTVPLKMIKDLKDVVIIGSFPLTKDEWRIEDWMVMPLVGTSPRYKEFEWNLK